MTFKRSRTAAVAAACLVVAVTSAFADNITGSFTLAQQNWVGNSSQAVKLSTLGSTSLNFANPNLGPVSIIFTAECQITGATTSYVDLTVLIDNVAVAPTAINDAFCSGRGVGIGGGLAHYALTVSKSLAIGQHIVEVNAIAVGSHTGAHLDNTTLTVRR